MSFASHSSHSSVIQLILGRGLMLSRGKGVWGSTITSASGREPQTPFPRDSINPPIIPLSFCHSLLISVIPVSFKSFHGQSRAKFFVWISEWGRDDGIRRNDRHLRIHFFLLLRKPLHSTSFRHSISLLNDKEWKLQWEDSIQQSFWSFPLHSNQFCHSRTMLEWPNEVKWREIFEQRQNP